MRATSRESLPFIALIGTGFVLVSDATRYIGAQGAVTVGLAGLCGLLFLNASLGKKLVAGRVLPPVPALLFAIWAALTLTWAPDLTAGVQNVLVYTLFVLVIGIAAATAKRSTPGRLLRLYRGAATLMSLAYLALVVRLGVEANSIITARWAAASAIIGVAAMVALTAVARDTSWGRYLIVWSAILTSLSRTAAAVAAVVSLGFAASSRTPGRAVAKLAALGLLAAWAAVWAYNNVEAVRARFDQSDGYTVGGFTLGSSGRALLWEVTIDHWRLRPWDGWGVGSSQEYVFRYLYPNAHPHNDYLRVLHDTGVVGLVLFLLAGWLLVRGTWKRYRATEDRELKALHFSAFLMLGGTALLMATDNPIVVVFYMVPVAVAVGVSQGLGVEAEPIETRPRVQAMRAKVR